MALDRSDFNHQVQQQQFGLQPGFWPIILNFATGAPGGTQMQVGQEYEININPCDNIWLPTIYDPSIGLNPAQQTPQLTVSGITMAATGLYGAMNAFNNNIAFAGISLVAGGPGALWGINAYDLWDSSNTNAACIQTATIFSLRFNSASAPWFIWTLSDFLGGAASFLPVSGSATRHPWSVVGQGDAMRSISGPVSRLWVKLLAPATVDQTASFPLSQVVLLSSLGYRQQTSGAKQLTWGGSQDLSGDFPSDTATQSQYSISGGGYTQTNLTTVERIQLEQAGQSNVRPPDGRR